MRSAVLDRVRPRHDAPMRRYASAGADLRSGEPLTAAQIRPGILDFRTPILILALQPVLDANEFARFLAENLRATYNLALMSCGVGIGAPFWQALPDDNTMLEASLVSLGVGQAAGLVNPQVGVGATAVGLAELFGWLVGSAANRIAHADRVIARWVTIEGTVDSRSRVTTPGEITDCIAASLVSCMRFRHPVDGSLLGSQAESVTQRTLEPGACSGARRFDKVIAAACTRVWPSARPAPAPTPTAPPGAPQLTQAPRVEVRRPTPEATPAWEGEGEAPPIPSGLAEVAQQPAGVKGFLLAHRRPIAGGLALAAVAGLAVALWPRGAAAPVASPAGRAALAR